MIKISKNTLNIILIIAVITALITGMVLMSGCKSGDVIIEEETTSEDDSDAGEVIEAGEADEDESGEEQDEDGGGTAEEPAGEEEASQENTEEVEEAEEIPVEITEEIKVAGGYFDDGMYAEAAKEYRDAARIIDDADISKGLKDELLAGISQNQQDAESITETARMHHGNGKTLEYEKRNEEAIAEYKAALEIYPKYQAAADAIDSLEALMGLK